jgi:hypothetical protein
MLWIVSFSLEAKPLFNLIHSCAGNAVDKARLATRKFLSSVELSSRAEKTGNRRRVDLFAQYCGVRSFAR